MIGRTLSFYPAQRFARTVIATFMLVFVLIYAVGLVELLRRSGGSQRTTGVLMAALPFRRTPIFAEQVDVELVLDRVDALGRLGVLDGCTTLGEALDGAAQCDDPVVARNGDLDGVGDTGIECDTRLNVVFQLGLSGHGLLLS